MSPASAAEPGAEPDASFATTAIADVVIAIPESPTAAEEASAIIADLSASPAIAWAADDQLSASGHAILVAYADEDGSAGPQAVSAAISEQENGATYLISGSDPVDREIEDRIGVALFWAVAFAAIAAATLISWLMGLVRGILSGLIIALAAYFGGAIGGAISGSFDGSLVTTAVPAVLAALVVAGYLLFRIFVWFSAPIGDDPADMIRRSVLAVAVEILLVFTGLGVVAVFLELTGSARSAATVVLVGAATSALLTLAVVPAVLAAAHGSSAEISGRAATDGTRSPGGDDLNLVSIPSGREFPVVVLAGFGLFLLAVGFFAFRSTSRAEFFDEGVLDADSAEVVAGQAMIDRGGDPTSAIYARFPVGTDQLAKTAWLERVSQLPTVARIDLATGRYQAGTFTAVENLIGPFDGVDVNDEAPGYALIVPSSTGRSPDALALVEAVLATNAPVDAELGGVPVDALAAEERDRSQVWLTILALAVIGGVAVFALIGDLGLAGITIGLRLVGLAAVAGMYHLLVGSASGAELQIAILIVALGMGLFELGYLRRLLASHRVADTDLLLDRAFNREGAAAALALGLAAVASFGLLIPDLAMLRRFGILLAVVILIKTVVGMWLLRPAILGTRAISHFASQPVRVALEALNGTSVTSQAEHKAWTEVINELLWTEFSFQADPASAEIASVFAADTALYRKSIDHHANLAQAGLRIMGRRPQLRALRVVSNSAPATVVATVDHPVRQLTDDNGKVVGVRKAERRSVMLWLVMQSDGSYRVADSVELGATELGVVAEPVPVPVAVPAALE